MTIFGAAYTSPTELIQRLEAVLGKGRVRLIVKNEKIPRRRAYIVVGVDHLRALSPELKHVSATIVVIDALPRLMTVKDITIIDTNKVDLHWQPCKPDYRALLGHARRTKPPKVEMIFGKDETLSRLIYKTRERGVLDKVLTMTHSLPMGKRSLVQSLVIRSLLGQVTTRHVIKKLQPARQGTRLWQAYSDLTDSLNGAYCQRLSRALREIHPNYVESNVIKASVKHDIDPTELRYIGTTMKKK